MDDPYMMCQSFAAMKIDDPIFFDIMQNILNDIIKNLPGQYSVLNLCGHTMHYIHNYNNRTSMGINGNCIIILFEGYSKKASCEVLQNIYDDSTSIIIKKYRYEWYHGYVESNKSIYLVRPINIARFIYAAFISEVIDWSLTYKNAQKIRSSSYGQALCDITIIAYLVNK